MLLPNIPKVDNNLFTFNRSKKTLQADISCLKMMQFSKLYDNAPETGIAVYHSKQNMITYWFVTNETEYGWELQPCKETIMQCPAVEEYKMTIWFW
jgi:hypothetical protein